MHYVFKFKIMLIILIFALCTPTYAKETNINMVSRFKGHVLESIDLSDTTLNPIYFQLDKKGYGMDPYSTYGFIGLSELNSSQTAILGKIYNHFIDNDYSEEAAAGICACIWKVSNFNISYNNNGAVGLLGWKGKRADILKNKYGIHSNHELLNIQLKYLADELNNSYSKDLNRLLYKYNGQKDFRKIKSSSIAADIWYIGMMDAKSDDNNKNAPMVNGHKWPELTDIRNKADRILNAKSTGKIGGVFAGMSNSDIVATIFPELEPYHFQIKYLDEIYEEKTIYNDLIVVIDLPESIQKSVNYQYRTISVNKFIEEDVKQLLNDLTKTNLEIVDIGCWNWRGVDQKNPTPNNQSFHSAGLAIDINNKYNPRCEEWDGSVKTIPEIYQPTVNPKCLTLDHANILKKYGFLWGMDFKTAAPDIMHFSIGEVDNDKYHLYDFYYAAVKRAQK